MIIKGTTYTLKPVTTKTYSDVVKLLKSKGVTYDLSDETQSQIDLLSAVIEHNLLPSLVNILFKAENGSNPNLEEIPEEDVQGVMKEIVFFFRKRVELLISIADILMTSTDEQNQPSPNTGV